MFDVYSLTSLRSNAARAQLQECCARINIVLHFKRGLFIYIRKIYTSRIFARGTGASRGCVSASIHHTVAWPRFKIKEHLRCKVARGVLQQSRENTAIGIVSCLMIIKTHLS